MRVGIVCARPPYVAVALFCFSLACASTKTGPSATAAPGSGSFTPAKQGEGQSAPFSLTISGGISLGAYEAGLNWVLVEWLKSRQQPAAGKFGPLIGVSGASAGAINALLTAVRWCQKSPETSIDGNLFSRSWREVGLDDLLSEDPGAYVGPDAKDPSWDPDFLFSRRSAFKDVFGRLKAALEASDYFPGCGVRLSIMVTKVRPRRITVEGLTTSSQRLVIPLVLEVNSAGTLQFKLNQQLLQDDRQRNLIGEVLLLPADGELVIARDDILKAIITSSAHPSSFGPVKLDHCARAVECPAQDRVKERDDVCQRLSSNLDAESATEGLVMCREPFLDGGAFDNVPIGMAMAQAESAAFPSTDGQASLPVNYIYLDPNVRRASAEQKDCSSGTGKPASASSPAKPELRDPMGELMTFVGGMFSSASDYELHNVLRFNKWNLTPKRIVTKADTLLTALCPDTGAPASCATAKERLQEAKALGPGVDPLAWTGNSGDWAPAWKTFLLKVKASLDTVAPQEGTAARFARDAQLRDLDELEKKPASARVLQIPNRFPAITGALLGHFAAFIDRPFRDYDYYAGVYDGLVAVAGWRCEGCNWSAREQEIRKWMARFSIVPAVQPSDGNEPPAAKNLLMNAFLEMERKLTEGPRPEPTCLGSADSETSAAAEKVLQTPVAPELQVQAALEEPSRCRYERGVCLRDVDFGRFIHNLSLTKYDGVSEIAKGALRRPDDWWTEPAVRGAMRLERVEEARPRGAKYEEAVSATSKVASVFTQHWYNDAHDPWYFRPQSDAVPSWLRLFSPSLSFATTKLRYASVGFFNYGAGSRSIVAIADASFRAGVPEVGDRTRFFTLDGAVGVALVVGRPDLTSVQLRGGYSFWASTDVPMRHFYELDLCLFLNHIRMGIGAESNGGPGWDHKYFKMTFADIAGLLEGIF
jgi:predicted acylesterase/phospholipase RssA